MLRRAGTLSNDKQRDATRRRLKQLVGRFHTLLPAEHCHRSPRLRAHVVPSGMRANGLLRPKVLVIQAAHRGKQIIHALNRRCLLRGKLSSKAVESSGSEIIVIQCQLVGSAGARRCRSQSARSSWDNALSEFRSPSSTDLASTLIRLRPTNEVRHRSQPPVGLDACLAHTAGSGCLHRFVRLCL